MIIQLQDGKKVDLNCPLDLSMTLRGDKSNPRAWYVNPPKFEPVRANGWIGSVKEGGDVNFRDIFFNPHGHGTHTECLGHITEKVHSLNDYLKTFFFNATVVSVTPEKINGDDIITPACLDSISEMSEIQALIIRTLPNDNSKKTRNYSDTNPPYISTDCIELINKLNVLHLLIDLPSVDKESDGGKLAFHHAFWNVPKAPRFDRTITELIFVPDHIKDGSYLLNLQVASFENDAAPSRPVLFEFK